MRLIETVPELEALAARMGAEPLLAVDTEAASFHRYRDRVYLLQISSRAETAVVDPLAVGTLAPLAPLLAVAPRAHESHVGPAPRIASLLRSPLLWVLGALILLYVGTENGVGGWTTVTGSCATLRPAPRDRYR